MSRHFHDDIINDLKPLAPLVFEVKPYYSTQVDAKAHLSISAPGLAAAPAQGLSELLMAGGGGRIRNPSSLPSPESSLQLLFSLGCKFLSLPTEAIPNSLLVPMSAQPTSLPPILFLNCGPPTPFL